MDVVILVLIVPFLALSFVGLFLWSRPTAARIFRAMAPAPNVSQRMDSLGLWSRQRLLPFFLVLLLLLLFAYVVMKWPAGSSFLQLMLLTRYSLASALLLVGLVPLAMLVLPNLLSNLFVLRRPVQLFHIAWLSVLVATMAVVTARVVEVNAVARYETSYLIAPTRSVPLLRFVVVLLLSMPVPLACFVRSRTRQKSWAIAGGFGLASGFVLVVLLSAMQFILLDKTVQDADLFPLHAVSRWIWEEVLGKYSSDLLYPAGQALANFLGDSPGLTVAAEGRRLLAPGHAQLAIVMGLVFLAYFVCYLLFSQGSVRNADSPFVSLSYLLLLLLMIGFLLQGAAFTLDRYHVPITLAVALVSFLQYQFANTDHFFYLVPPGQPETDEPAAAPRLLDVVRHWQFPSTLATGNGSQPRRVLVAVTASGGGIQAAAWTCRVLTGLHDLYVDDLARSTFLISAVSGGSVGTMYYLDSFGQHKASGLPPLMQQDAGKLPRADSSMARSMESSLEATAWGLAFPDFLRMLLPPVVARSDDRGARIETAWRSRLSSPDTRLSDWTNAVVRGALPIPVFNATVVETGQRFLASPVLGRAPAAPQNWQARQLRELYPDADPYVSALVRLSATFPFVSPICRPWPLRTADWKESLAYHFADGGYVDNEGMVTVIEWLYDLLDPDYFPLEERQRKFDQILIIRIVPFPVAAGSAAEQGRGWLYSTIGPIETLMNVRASSQQERNDLAVQLFQQALRRVRGCSEQERRDLGVHMFTKAIEHAQHDPSPEKKEELALLLFNEVASYYQVPVDVAKFTFEPTNKSEAPLCWMLTDPQKMEINEAWQWLISNPSPNSPLRTLDHLFRRRVEG
jgi:hypothetical protein